MKTLSLCGEWRLRYSTGQRGAWHTWPNPQPFIKDYSAQVPGTVQEAMQELTGDVHLGHNVLNARWIEENVWNYTRHFSLTPDDRKGRVRLVFEGLDMTAVIYVNRRRVGSANNFYLPCRLDVTDFLQDGDNEISVTIDSGLFYGSDHSIAGLCGDGDPGNRLTHRMWLRKPQSAFEWDWSPRLVTVGIFRPCYLELSSGIFADETSVFASVSDDYKTGSVRLRQFLHNTGAAARYAVTATVRETGDSTTVTGELPANSVIPAELTLTVSEPALWYPIGYGVQTRYTIDITVSQEGCEDIKLTKKTGFRRVVIDQSPHPTEGYNFILLVNGVKTFAKGGNMVPADILYSKLTRDVYEKLIDLAVEANYNMLRVWGGGLYETDDFYDLCDEHGIMVWQDFINACAAYPGYDNDFFNNYAAEIRYQIRRLSTYPSLVIYAGNNELIWLTASYGGKHYPDAQLYHWLIPKTLKSEGEDRYYQPSSPYSFDNTDDNSDIVGDQHPWFIGFSDRNYFKYRQKDGRFPNEGGMLGPTSLPNMLACFSEGQAQLHSFDWEVHDNSIAHGHMQSSDLMLEEWLDISTDGMSIPDYVYGGGFCQGEGLTEYILNFRRRMYSTCSAIFWMYNDCWPATRSWTIVDYLRNRTPSFYPVKRSNAPVAVNIVRDGDRCSVYVMNERSHPINAILEYGAFSAAGEYSFRETARLVLAPGASTVVAVFDAPPAGFIPYAELDASGEPLSRRRLVEDRYFKLGLHKAEISEKREGDCVTFTADVPVFGVCIDLDGDSDTGDNFFDLFPGKPYTVRVGQSYKGVLYTLNGYLNK